MMVKRQHKAVVMERCLYCINVRILGGCDIMPQIYGLDEPQSVYPLEKAE